MFQIVIAVYMLYNIVGTAVFAGLGVMILLIPVNGVMATIQRKLQISQMTLKDKRIKLMNEVLNGIKVLKVSCTTILSTNIDIETTSCGHLEGRCASI